MKIEHMMLRLIILFLLPSILYAQNDLKGIKFEKVHSWEQIKQKAAMENKFIFVDCYATWCLPCRIMDREIYSNDTIAELMNEKFISLKVQMDTSKNDDENIKATYSIARELEKQFEISGLPTFLFFSSDGSPVHFDMGGKSVNEFCSLIDDALDSNKQLFTLIGKWKSGRLAYERMPAVADRLREYKMDSLSLLVAKSYMHNYLDVLTGKAFCSIENLRFLRRYDKMVTSKDKIFRFYVKSDDLIDSLMGEAGYSRIRVLNIVGREEVWPKMLVADKIKKSPKWKKITRIIIRKYGSSIATESIVHSKLNWYKYKGDWDNYLASLMQLWNMKMYEFPNYGWVYLNDQAWKVCVNSKKEDQLRTALLWINIALLQDTSFNAAMLDTKANLLYKLKYSNEAIAVESKLVDFFKLKTAKSVSDFDKKYNPIHLKNHQERIKKMQRGEDIDLVN